MIEKRTIRAPRGNELSCKGWHQEAALRMLMNNLDPEVAEDPDNLIVYGGTGRAARSWEAFDAIVRSLRELENDETLLVQSGKPVGIFRTHDQAPRVLIANSNLVGQWSNYPEFNRLEKLGLTMYGQMTAGSWIYIASQGIVQGTFETFSAAGERHFDGSLEGKLLVTGGLGGMGGAQPLAATMAGALCLGIEVDPTRIEKRLQSGYCDKIARSLDEAMQLLNAARAKKEATSVGLVGNCADILPEMVRRDIVPDVLTDQTSAHDALNGYVPNGMTLSEALQLRVENPDEYVERSMAAMAQHVDAMLALQEKGAITFDYGNNIRTQAKKAGCEKAFNIPGFVPEYIRPLFCEGKGPFRWVALSGDPADIARTDRLALELFPGDRTLARWMKLAQKRIQFQGLPARICWVGLGDRHRLRRHPERAPRRARDRGGQGRQARHLREADGEHGRRVRRDPRRLPHGRGSAVDRLPAALRALPRGARAPGPHGGARPLHPHVGRFLVRDDPAAVARRTSARRRRAADGSRGLRHPGDAHGDVGCAGRGDRP
jgi:urocanate hydratase